MNAILDDDIEIKQCYMDEPSAEEESYKSCVVYILLIMAYCFIELRYYSSAINCLNECEKEVGDLVPDVFLRRAQALMNKKNATKLELQKAEEDLEKSIILATKFNEEFPEHSLNLTDLYNYSKSFIIKDYEINNNMTNRSLVEASLTLRNITYWMNIAKYNHNNTNRKYFKYVAYSVDENTIGAFEGLMCRLFDLPIEYIDYADTRALELYNDTKNNDLYLTYILAVYNQGILNNISFLNNTKNNYNKK